MRNVFTKTLLAAFVAGAATVLQAGDVCKIGETGYVSLQTAFDAVKDDETITLVSDVALGTTSSATQWFENDVAATLDLNGQKITGGYSSNGAIAVTGGTLTIDDSSEGATGSIAVSQTSGSYAVIFGLGTAGGLVLKNGRFMLTSSVTYTYGIYITGTGARLSIEGGELSVSTSKSTAYGVYNRYGQQRITMTGGSVSVTSTYSTGYAYGIYNYDAAPIDISGGTVLTSAKKTSLAVYNSGTGAITISGGDICAKGVTTMNAAAANGTAKRPLVVITGGRLASVNLSTGAVGNMPVGVCTVRGGKFSKAPQAAYLATGYKLQEISEAATIAGCAVTLVSEAIVDETVPDVVELASTSARFKSINLAIDAAAATDTVKLLGDIDSNENVVVPGGKTLALELDGHTLALTNATTSTAVGCITVSGGLTIQDTSAGTAGRICAKGYGVVVAKNGSLTLASGTIEAIGTSSTYGIYCTSPCAVNVTGGTIRIDSSYNYVYVIGNATASCAINVTGGDFFLRSTSKSAKKYAYFANNGTGSVTGGRFACTFMPYNTTLFGTTVNVEGGSFNFDPSAYVPIGNKMVVDTGTETVSPFGTEITLKYQVVVNPDAKVVAKVVETGAEFYSAQAAVDAAEAGETVQMQGDVALGTKNIVIAKAITFDLNGHSITSGQSTVQITGGTAAQPIRIVDTADEKGVIAGVSAVHATSGASCHVVVDGVTLFGTTRIFYDQSGDSADRSSILLTNVTGRVVADATGKSSSRCGLFVTTYSDVVLKDCDFTVDALKQTPSSTTSQYFTMFHYGATTPTVTIDGGSYRVIAGANAYANMVLYLYAKPHLTVNDGRFAIETGATPKSVAFYAQGLSTDTTGIYISLNGGDYTENINPALWIAKNRNLVASEIPGYAYHIETLTMENSAAMIVTGGETNFYMTVAKALADAQSGDVVEVLNPSAESVSLAPGVTLKSNGKFTGAVASTVTTHKIVNMDGVYSCVAYTADDAEAMVTYEGYSVTNYYGALTNAIKAANGSSTRRVTLLRDVTLGDVYYKTYSSGAGGYVYSLLPTLSKLTIDGWDAKLGRAHTIADSGRFSGLCAIPSASSLTLENLVFTNVTESLVFEADTLLTMRNVDVYGTIEGTGNTGIYCIFCWDDATFVGCTNHADLKGKGLYTDYEAIFIGYARCDDYTATLAFTNCVNAGRASTGKLAMFIGNPCSYNDIILNVSGCENRGSLVATFVSDATAIGEYEDYNMNWYFAVDSGCRNLILNGEAIDASTVNFENITEDSTHGVVNAPEGIVENGPIDTGMRLYELSDKTFYVLPATDNSVTNIAFSCDSKVAYYKVSVGLYVKLANGSGSSRYYVTQRFAANENPGFQTELKNLDFVDLNFVDGGKTSLLAGNKTFTTNGITYYVVNNNDYTTHGEVWPAEFRHVTAFDADDNLLATATLGAHALGCTVNGIDISEGSGPGWTYDFLSGVIEITAGVGAEKTATISGSAPAVRLRVADGADISTLCLENFTNGVLTADKSALEISSDVTVVLAGVNSFVAGANSSAVEIADGVTAVFGGDGILVAEPGHDETTQALLAGIAVGAGSECVISNGTYSSTVDPAFVPWGVGPHYAGFAIDGTSLWTVGEAVTVDFTDEDSTLLFMVTNAAGALVAEPATPTKEGHLFKGWTNEVKAAYWDFATDTADAGTVWTLKRVFEVVTPTTPSSTVTTDDGTPAVVDTFEKAEEIVPSGGYIVVSNEVVATEVDKPQIIVAGDGADTENIVPSADSGLIKTNSANVALIGTNVNNIVVVEQNAGVVPQPTAAPEGTSESAWTAVSNMANHVTATDPLVIVDRSVLEEITEDAQTLGVDALISSLKIEVTPTGVETGRQESAEASEKIVRATFDLTPVLTVVQVKDGVETTLYSKSNDFTMSGASTCITIPCGNINPVAVLHNHTGVLTVLRRAAVLAPGENVFIFDAVAKSVSFDMNAFSEVTLIGEERDVVIADRDPLTGVDAAGSFTLTDNVISNASLTATKFIALDGTNFLRGAAEFVADGGVTNYGALVWDVRSDNTNVWLQGFDSIVRAEGSSGLIRIDADQSDGAVTNRYELAGPAASADGLVFRLVGDAPFAEQDLRVNGDTLYVGKKIYRLYIEEAASSSRHVDTLVFEIDRGEYQAVFHCHENLFAEEHPDKTVLTNDYLVLTGLTLPTDWEGEDYDLYDVWEGVAHRTFVGWSAVNEWTDLYGDHIVWGAPDDDYQNGRAIGYVPTGLVTNIAPMTSGDREYWARWTYVDTWSVGADSDNVVTATLDEATCELVLSANAPAAMKDGTYPGDTWEEFAADTVYPWYNNFRSLIHTLRVSANVTHIGDYAFCDCASLEEIFFEGGVPDCGEPAFRYCPIAVGYYEDAYKEAWTNVLDESGNWNGFKMYNRADVPTCAGDGWYVRMDSSGNAQLTVAPGITEVTVTSNPKGYLIVAPNGVTVKNAASVPQGRAEVVVISGFTLTSEKMVTITITGVTQDDVDGGAVYNLIYGKTSLDDPEWSKLTPTSWTYDYASETLQVSFVAGEYRFFKVE